MEVVSVAEVADRLGVSRQRVVQLIGAGRLHADRLGRSWAVPEEEVAALEAGERLGVRPMSARMARGMVDLMGQGFGEPAGEAWLELPHRERSRLRRRLEELRGGEGAAALLRAWLPRRCHAERFVFHGGPAELFDDERLSAGGALHPAIGLSGGSLMEPHVADSDREGVIWDLLLVPSPSGNVLLRSEPVLRVDLAACLVDIAEAGGGRNDSIVEQWIAEMSANG